VWFLCRMLGMTAYLYIAVLWLKTSRITRSDEDKDGSWDAWGAWSDCSRTCGGGASYSLRRCLNGRNCEGRNIRYKTCSNNDCPSDVGDFRAQQCSAYNDVKYQGHFYEWIPVYNDPTAPCALKCQALGKNLIVELAPKVLDGTRCNIESLDMCISGICQVCSWCKSKCDLCCEAHEWVLSGWFFVCMYKFTSDLSASTARWIVDNLPFLAYRSS
uniref:ADAMTS like 3 n=1 Tax=Amazona collaria TaxID=241587 RepID=A0A8B9FGJ1_9PSIT